MSNNLIRKIIFKNGGKTKHKIEAEGGEIIQSNKPIKIKNGGIAIPLGNGYNLLKGRKHSQGGIDIDMKGDGRVWSDVPFLNGESPAKKVLDGENPNIVFNQQELFKKINKIKDDGTKKRYGGEEDNYRPKVLKPNSNDKHEPIIFEDLFTKNLKNEAKKDLEENKVTKTNKSRGRLNNDKSQNIEYYKDDEGNLYSTYVGNISETHKKILNLTQLHDDEKNDSINKFRKELDYIGGNNSRNKMWKKLPKTIEFVDSIANKYNISPDLLKHRLSKEGFIDKVIDNYNYYKNKNQQQNIDNELLEESGYDAFGHFGLDDTGSLLLDNKLNLKDSISWYTFDATNEKGRKVIPAGTDNVKGNIILQAATLEYLKDELRKRNISENELDKYANAAYNMGLYNKNLKNKEYVDENYTVPKYSNEKKKYGGNMNKNSLIYNLNGNVKQGLGFVPSTGKKPKAALGMSLGAADWITAGANLIGSIGSYFHNKKSIDNQKTPEGPSEPIGIQATKLNTTYNIEPQLSTIREAEAKQFKDIDQNTTSSAVALARKQLARLGRVDSELNVRNNAEIEKNKLINQDRLNKQQVYTINTQNYNQHQIDKYKHKLTVNQLENERLAQQAQNTNALVNNLTGTIGGLMTAGIANYQNKKYEEMLKKLLDK